MGRVNANFNRRLKEEVSRIRREIGVFLGEEEGEALEELVVFWMENEHVLSNFSNPYLLGSLCLLSIINIVSRLKALEKKLEELERVRVA